MLSELPPGFTCPGCGLTAVEMREEVRRTAYIEALLEEKRTHPAETAAIDAELARVGHTAATPAARAERRPASHAGAETR